MELAAIDLNWLRQAKLEEPPAGSDPLLEDLATKIAEDASGDLGSKKISPVLISIIIQVLITVVSHFVTPCLANWLSKMKNKGFIYNHLVHRLSEGLPPSPYYDNDLLAKAIMDNTMELRHTESWSPTIAAARVIAAQQGMAPPATDD